MREVFFGTSSMKTPEELAWQEDGLRRLKDILQANHDELKAKQEKRVQERLHADFEMKPTKNGASGSIPKAGREFKICRCN